MPAPRSLTGARADLPPDAPAGAPATPPRASTRQVRLPRWTWSYVAFRFGDGVTSGLIPLAVVLYYGEPLWGLALLTATMNLAGVPATFLWGKLVDLGTRRRPIVVTGFAVASLSLATIAALPPLPLFVLAAVLYTVFGVATAPAASTMVLQKVPRSRWGRTTAALSRRTGFAYLAGMGTAITIAAPIHWWAALGDTAFAFASRLGLGGPHFNVQFAVSALTSMAAALIALRLVPTWHPPLPHETLDRPVVQAAQRRFDRPVFFPGRLSGSPTLRAVLDAFRDPHRLWPLGYAFTFMGSVCFFSSYPGVLAGPLALPAGLILLAQLPSNLVSPMAYPWAGRWGALVGESRGILHGSFVRTATLPLLAVTVAFAGSDYYLALLLLHAFMGLSFALIQVNGPVLLAEVHPGGRGQGVGTYHAAVGIGTLLGSLMAALLLRLLDYRWSYVFAVAAALVGCLLLWTAHRARSARPTVAVVQAPTA